MIIIIVYVGIGLLLDDSDVITFRIDICSDPETSKIFTFFPDYNIVFKRGNLNVILIRILIRDRVILERSVWGVSTRIVRGIRVFDPVVAPINILIHTQKEILGVTLFIALILWVGVVVIFCLGGIANGVVNLLRRSGLRRIVIRGREAIREDSILNLYPVDGITIVRKVFEFS